MQILCSVSSSFYGIPGERLKAFDLFLLGILRSDSSLDSQRPTLWSSCRQMQSRLIAALPGHLQTWVPEREKA